MLIVTITLCYILMMLVELRTFVAIARFGTFSMAADRIGLTQAAVSGHIRRLEEQLGFPLFDRTGRSATLNAEGARTLPRAQAIVAAVDALGDPEDNAASGHLKIGAIASLQSSLLARALVPFRNDYPNLKIQVVPGLSLHLLDQVDSGDLDLAILIRPPFDLPPDLEWQLLAREAYALIAPSSFQGDDWRTLLQTQPFLRYDRLSFGGRQVDRFLRNLPFKVTDVIEVPVQAMITMVQNGLGVALIPMTQAHLPLPVGVRALPLEGQDISREIGLIRSRQNEFTPRIDFLAKCLAEAVTKPQGGPPSTPSYL